MIDRRTALTALGALLLLPSMASAAIDTDKVVLTDAQWKARLSPEAFDILRREGTEEPFSSPLDHEKRAGTYFCAGCDLALYSSKTKYDSGSGWPSFWKPLPNAISTKVDNSLAEERNEVHCRRCNGHLGHVFDDGPKPTGLRYCMDGVALNFRPGVIS
jgi:peptide-methionine (R)-S-oxide reductase